MAVMQGGPYDGLDIDHTLINKHCDILSLDSHQRVIILMPPLEHWDAIVIEAIPSKNQEWKLWPYERVVKDGAFTFAYFQG